MLASPSIYNHHSQSILIVDDNEMLLELLTEGFEMFGFNVLKADNGLDA
jgi:DNA-binding response OmpR family regulator